MRCRSCGERWDLEAKIGPGGDASPGQYSVVGLGALIAAVVLGIYQGWFIGVLVGFFATLILFMALCVCGHQPQAMAYQGSVCPKCGTDNFIWPWNF